MKSHLRVPIQERLCKACLSKVRSGELCSYGCVCVCVCVCVTWQQCLLLTAEQLGLLMNRCCNRNCVTLYFSRMRMHTCLHGCLLCVFVCVCVCMWPQMYKHVCTLTRKVTMSCCVAAGGEKPNSQGRVAQPAAVPRLHLLSHTQLMLLFKVQMDNDLFFRKCATNRAAQSTVQA